MCLFSISRPCSFSRSVPPTLSLAGFHVEYFPCATTPSEGGSLADIQKVSIYFCFCYSELFEEFPLIMVYLPPTSGYHRHNTASIWQVHSHTNSLIYPSFGRYPSQHSCHARPICKLSKYSRDARRDDSSVGTWFSVCKASTTVEFVSIICCPVNQSSTAVVFLCALKPWSYERVMVVIFLTRLNCRQLSLRLFSYRKVYTDHKTNDCFDASLV